MTHCVTRNGQTVCDSNLVKPWINMSVAATYLFAAEEILLYELRSNLLHLDLMEFFDCQKPFLKMKIMAVQYGF